MGVVCGGCNVLVLIVLFSVNELSAQLKHYC